MDAVQEAANLIKDDLTLERVREVKDQLAKQRSTVDYQLSKEQEKYFGLIRSALSSLSDSQKSISSIREHIEKVNELSSSSKIGDSNYDIIYKATRLYELITRTSDIHDKIVGLDRLAVKIDKMLAIEEQTDPMDTGAPYLLHIHALLNGARDFEERMSVLAFESTNDSQRLLQRVVRKLPELTRRFDALLKMIIYDLNEFVRNEQTTVLIKFFKIMYFEDIEDMKIEAARRVIMTKEKESEKNLIRKLPNDKYHEDNHINVDKDQPSNKALYRELLNGSIPSRIKVRGYKALFSENLRASIQSMFAEAKKVYQGEKMFDILNNLDWVENELIIAKEHLSKYCPPSWNIFSVYFNFFFNELHDLINKLVDSEPETLIILDILDYDRNFQKTLVSEFGFSKKDAKSVIGEQQKETLYTDYLNLIVVKMSEWFRNLEKAEFDVFLERTTPPHTDAEGLNFLDGTKTCFQMFTQQVEVAAGSNQAKILVGVIEKFCDLLVKRQSHWIEKIKSEVQRIVNYNHKYDEDPDSITPEDECPGGLVEYLIAASNDQMRAADYAMALSTKYGQLVSKQYEREITVHMDSTLDGFAEVSQVCTLGLTTIIFDDLRIPYSEIFAKSWYKGSQAQQIADTLREYLDDIRSQLNPIVFAIFVESIIEETVFKYISAIKNGHSIKHKNNKFLEAVKRDFQIFYKLFEAYLPPTTDPETDQVTADPVIAMKFGIMEYFMDLCCEPISELPQTWTKLLEKYWDAPVDLFAAIMKCRKDVDNSDTKKLMQSISAITNDPERIARLQQQSQNMEESFISRF